MVAPLRRGPVGPRTSSDPVGYLVALADGVADASGALVDLEFPNLDTYSIDGGPTLDDGNAGAQRTLKIVVQVRADGNNYFCSHEVDAVVGSSGIGVVTLSGSAAGYDVQSGSVTYAASIVDSTTLRIRVTVPASWDGQTYSARADAEVYALDPVAA